MVRFLIISMKLYRLFISPLYGPCCRFYPTCSEYALESLETHGIYGVILTTKRVLRCNPFGGAGYDPIPQLKKTERK